jgi:hypothetical protein
MLVEVVSRNGVLALNLAPKGDGPIPDDQQECVRAIGRWLQINSDAIYGTESWIKQGEGTLRLARGQRKTAKEIRFTAKGGNLFAIVMEWPRERQVVMTSFPAEAPMGNATSVSLLVHRNTLPFAHDAEGLKILLPERDPGNGPYAIRISALRLRARILCRQGAEADTDAPVISCGSVAGTSVDKRKASHPSEARGLASSGNLIMRSTHVSSRRSPESST